MARDNKRRGWVWAGALLGLIIRTFGAGVLFWAIFPLWLSVFWTVQGYPPTLRDLPRWYALGAFNIAPIVATVLISPLVVGVMMWARRNAQPENSNLPPPAPLSVYGEGGDPAAERGGSPPPFTERGLGGEVKNASVNGVLTALLYALLVPPTAYALLLIYADMWQYRAWDAMTPTLFRAYLMLAPACGFVGALVGWTLRK